MHEVLVNRLGGLSLPRKSVVRLTDRPDMTLDVYRGRKTTTQPILWERVYKIPILSTECHQGSFSLFLPDYLPLSRCQQECVLLSLRYVTTSLPQRFMTDKKLLIASKKFANLHISARQTHLKASQTIQIKYLAVFLAIVTMIVGCLMTVVQIKI